MKRNCKRSEKHRKKKYAPTGAVFATEKPHKKSPAAQKGRNIDT